MKDWKYYSTPKVPYFGHAELLEFESELVEIINNTPMTAAERQEALTRVKQRGRERAKEQNQPYYNRQKELEKEFWEDARAELGYDTLLYDDGVAALESKAYEDGHSYGFEEVYNHLVELTEFVKTILAAARPKRGSEATSYPE